MLKTLAAGALIAAFAAAPALAETCTPIHFAPGTSSATVKGTAPAEDVVCYTFGAGAGQNASVKVTGRNTIVSIDGVKDAMESYTFKTKAQTYKLSVGQLMRSVTNEPFTLTLSVK